MSSVPASWYEKQGKGKTRFGQVMNSIQQLPFNTNWCFPGEAPPPDLSLGRTDRRSGHLSVFVISFVDALFWGLQASSVKFQVECSRNYVLGPPGARDMTSFVKHLCLAEDALGENHS